MKPHKSTRPHKPPRPVHAVRMSISSPNHSLLERECVVLSRLLPCEAGVVHPYEKEVFSSLSKALSMERRLETLAALSCICQQTLWAETSKIRLTGYVRPGTCSSSMQDHQAPLSFETASKPSAATQVPQPSLGPCLYFLLAIIPGP